MSSLASPIIPSPGSISSCRGTGNRAPQRSPHKPGLRADKHHIAAFTGRIRFLKTYTVFNVAQIDGLAERFQIVPEPAPEAERIDAAEAFFARIPATVHHGGDKAYYMPSADRIWTPAITVILLA